MSRSRNAGSARVISTVSRTLDLTQQKCALIMYKCIFCTPHRLERDIRVFLQNMLVFTISNLGRALAFFACSRAQVVFQLPAGVGVSAILRYIRCIALHATMLSRTTLHCIALDTTAHRNTLHYSALHTTQHCATLHTAQRVATLHYYDTLHGTALCFCIPHCIALHRAALDRTTRYLVHFFWTTCKQSFISQPF